MQDRRKQAIEEILPLEQTRARLERGPFQVHDDHALRVATYERRAQEVYARHQAGRTTWRGDHDEAAGAGGDTIFSPEDAASPEPLASEPGTTSSAPTPLLEERAQQRIRSSTEIVLQALSARPGETHSHQELKTILASARPDLRDDGLKNALATLKRHGLIEGSTVAGWRRTGKDDACWRPRLGQTLPVHRRQLSIPRPYEPDELPPIDSEFLRLALHHLPPAILEIELRRLLAFHGGIAHACRTLLSSITPGADDAARSPAADPQELTWKSKGNSPGAESISTEARP